MPYKDPEKRREFKRKRYEANREKVCESQRKYYEANREKQRESQRKYYEANRDKMLERRKKYHEANRDKILERHKKYYEANRDKMLEWKKEYHEANREKLMIQGARKRARKKGLPFDLVLEDIIIPTHCPVLGIPLERSSGVSGPKSPSLDRIVPELGYVKGNVVVISNKANTIKTNATPEEVLAVALWLRSIHPSTSTHEENSGS
jgi:hypothetical protein